MLSIYRLPNKLPHERVIKVIRKDVFLMFVKLLFLFLMIVLPVGFFMLFIKPNEFLMNWNGAYPLIVLMTSAYYLFLWLFAFFTFIDYYLDVWIITNERIIDIEQRGFFSRVIAEHKLFRIQDVTSEVHGVFPTLIGYGDIFVQTAGTKQRFHFDDIPNPGIVRNMIIKLVQKKKKDVIREEAKLMKH